MSSSSLSVPSYVLQSEKIRNAVSASTKSSLLLFSLVVITHLSLETPLIMILLHVSKTTAQIPVDTMSTPSLVLQNMALLELCEFSTNPNLSSRSSILTPPCPDFGVGIGRKYFAKLLHSASKGKNGRCSRFISRTLIRRVSRTELAGVQTITRDDLRPSPEHSVGIFLAPHPTRSVSRQQRHSCQGRSSLFAAPPSL